LCVWCCVVLFLDFSFLFILYVVPF
jgi:hypothetical protein